MSRTTLHRVVTIKSRVTNNTAEVGAAYSDPPAGAAARLGAAGGIVIVGMGSALVWFFDPTRSSFFPVCPLFTLTGLACPGCGMTRAFHALFNGDLAGALGYNALIPFVALAFAFIVVSLISVAAKGKGLVRLSSAPPYLFGVLVLLLTFGVLRNLPFYPFTLLYP